MSDEVACLPSCLPTPLQVPDNVKDARQWINNWKSKNQDALSDNMASARQLIDSAKGKVAASPAATAASPDAAPQYPPGFVRTRLITFVGIVLGQVLARIECEQLNQVFVEHHQSGGYLPSRTVRRVSVACRYSCFYLTRNSLTYTAPAMVATASLGIGLKEVCTKMQTSSPLR